jgi:hypothetical protein
MERKLSLHLEHGRKSNPLSKKSRYEDWTCEELL